MPVPPRAPHSIQVRSLSDTPPLIVVQQVQCVWQIILAHLWQLTLAHLWQVAKQDRGMEIRWASGWSVAEARSPARASISQGTTRFPATGLRRWGVLMRSRRRTRARRPHPPQKPSTGSPTPTHPSANPPCPTSSPNGKPSPSGPGRPTGSPRMIARITPDEVLAITRIRQWSHDRTP